jgi:hypothetical protein
MRNQYFPIRGVLAGLTACLLSTTSHAGTYTADFNSGTPAGLNVFGSAKIEDDATGGTNTTGVLKLTEANVGSTPASAILDDIDPGAVVSGFEVNFSMHIGRGNGADGMSFFFGDFADAAHSEEGPGTIRGLTVAFDVFNNATGGGVPEAPAIDVKWNNNIISHRLVGAASATTGASPITGSPVANTFRTQTTANGISVYVPVKIRVETDGRFSLAYNNTVIFTNLPIFRPITDPTIGPAVRFGFAARTGGSHDDHWIDNLSITTVTTPAAGQPYVISLNPVSLASATAGAPASAVGGVSIVFQDSAASVNPGSVQVRYNNTVVTHTVTRAKSAPDLAAEDLTIIGYSPTSGVLPTGVGTVQVNYASTSTPALTNSFTYTFVVGAATSIPASWAVTGVDTNSIGFKGRVYQMAVPRTPGDQNLTQIGERQVAKGYIDPATGQPYADISTIDPASLDVNGYFDIPGPINFNQTEAAGGLINAGSNPSRPDEILPGMAADSTDNLAYEFIGYLHLPAGGHRIGFHADDRIRFSLGPAHQAAGTPVLLATTGANAESFADLLVAETGFYPLRIGFWEGGGDARIEIFSVEPGTNRRILLNDPELPSLKVYRESSNDRPSIARVLPVAGWIGAFPDDDVVIDIRDGDVQLDPSTIILRINGTDQTIATSKTGRITTITRDSSMDNLLPSGNTTVQLIYGFTEGGTAIKLTNDYTFVVAPYYGVLPAANRVPAASVSGSGFTARLHQMDRTLNANQGAGGRIAGGGDANRMPWPEVQLNNGMINPTNGLPYPNLVQSAATFELINFNAPLQTDPTTTITATGLFQGAQPPSPHPGASADAVMPGLPGGGTSPAASATPGAGTVAPGSENYVMEALTYLNLKRGVYVFGINSDDGFVVTSAPDPHDTLGTLVGFANMGRGNAGNALGGLTLPAGQSSPQITQGANSATFVFGVIVPEDGIYPFRILYWQGGGGVNAEFYTMNRQNGSVILVNDTAADPNTVTALSTYTGPARPWTKFSVSPTPWDSRFQQAGPGPITLIGGTRAQATSAADIYNLSDATRPWADIAIGGVIANGTSEPNLRLLLDGTEVPATKTTSGTDVTVSYRPNPPLASNSTHSASLVYAGTTNSWSFTVQPYTTLNAADARPSSAADPTARGFSVKVVQAASGQANTAARAEAQLAGTPANVAQPGPEPEGRYIVTNIVNWSTGRTPGTTQTAETGNFQDNSYGSGWPFPDYPDQPVPGLPGTGLTGDARFQNVTAEIFAWLDLPTAGYYRFGGNADDGIVVKVGTPGVTNVTVIFTQDRGAGNQDIPFSFVAPQAGLYPIRFLWYQGGGGGNVEFFSYDANGKKIAVNDPNDPNAIKAYYRITDDSGGRPVITVTRAASGDINITWTNGGTLQATSVLGPNAAWADVDSDGSFSTTATGAQRFFRVRK